VRRHDHRHLRGEADALLAHGFRGVVEGVGLEGGEGGEGGYGRAQHVHRVAVLHRLDDRQDLARQAARRLQLGIEFGELLCRGEFAVKQEIGRLLEARMLGEVMDRIAAISQLARLAVDEAGAGAFEINALQATVDFDLFFC
jgi:hypothetical protein